MHTFTHGDKTIAITVLSGEMVGSEKLEIPVQVEAPAPALAPAETESAALNSDSVRRALSRNR